MRRETDIRTLQKYRLEISQRGIKSLATFDSVQRDEASSVSNEKD